MRRIVLTLYVAFMLILAFHVQQPQVVSEVSADEVYVPAFVQENELVYEGGATYQWLDPHVSFYQFDYWTLWHSVETLFWYERDNATKIIPWLVESYVESADRLHYNLTLRQGITFQDGTPFNATAVWFSMNRLLVIDGTSGDGLYHGTQAAWTIQQMIDPDGNLFAAMGAQPSYDSSWIQDVLDLDFMEIIDNYTIKVNIVAPTTQLLTIIACPWAGIVSPTSTIKMDYEHGGWGTWDENYNTYFEHMAGNGHTGLVLPEDGWKVGSGPYYVESVEATTPYTIILKAYDDYWGGPLDEEGNPLNLPPPGKTRIETIEYRYVPSFATRLLDLEAGEATGIAVPAANLFETVDQDKWLQDDELVSLIDDATVHGIFPRFFSYWFNFCTNISRPDETLKDWQPFADWRIRMAVASSVNMTEMNIDANNKLGVVASSIIPPDTYPPGSHNASVKTTFSFNLTRAEELLLAASESPLTSFTYYNGTLVPPGVIDNSFGPSFFFAKPVEFYVQAGAEHFQQVLNTMADNLNAIAFENDLGIRFVVVVVPGGHQYSLAQQHLIDSYMGGWIADYNHVLNWLQPMYLSTGTYYTWNQWNLTALDNLYYQALEADALGNIDELVRLSSEMNAYANEALTYMVWWHPADFFVRSEWLQGWYENVNYGFDLWSTMYYEEPWPELPGTIEDLRAEIEELGSEGEIDNQGLVKSLIAKLNTAQRLIDKEKIEEARAILEDDFIPQVQELSGIHITVEAAGILIQSAEYILSHL